MLERWGETILGAIVAIVAIGFFAFAAAQAGQTSNSAGYPLSARFQRVDGVAVGTDVRVSGVKVGVVRTVALDPETFLAKLDFVIDRGVEVPDDSTARVASDGLLGGAYIAIDPGSGDALPAGGEIINTQGAIDLLTVLSSAMSGMNRGPTETTTEESAP
jgi:phospholipid/cholesterol/gamma-HCH transport system substrate-binding protein